MKWLFNYWREAISSTPTHARLCLAQSQYLGGKEQQRGVEPIKQSVRQEIQFTKRKDGETEREKERGVTFELQVLLQNDVFHLTYFSLLGGVGQILLFAYNSFSGLDILG